MGIFGIATTAELAKVSEQLDRIERAIASLHIVTGHQEQGFAAIHGRLDELGTATARSVQGVADQILHLQLPPEPATPEPAPAPAPAEPRPAGTGRGRPRQGG